MSSRIPKTLLSSVYDIYDKYGGSVKVSIQVGKQSRTMSIEPVTANKESVQSDIVLPSLSTMERTF